VRRSETAGERAEAVLGVKLASQATHRLRRFPQESLTLPRGSGAVSRL